MLGIEADVLTGMGAVRCGDLETVTALRTGDQEHFTMREAVKALEDMHAAQRDPLPGATLAAGETNAREEGPQRAHDQGPMASAGLTGRSGWPASRKSSWMRSW